jgi:hypothetical protein
LCVVENAPSTSDTTSINDTFSLAAAFSLTYNTNAFAAFSQNTIALGGALALALDTLRRNFGSLYRGSIEPLLMNEKTTEATKRRQKCVRSTDVN